MLYFFLGIALLILGYFTYGAYIARVLKLDPKKECPRLQSETASIFCRFRTGRIC